MLPDKSIASLESLVERLEKVVGVASIEVDLSLVVPEPLRSIASLIARKRNTLTAKELDAIVTGVSMVLLQLSLVGPPAGANKYLLAFLDATREVFNHPRVKD